MTAHNNTWRLTAWPSGGVLTMLAFGLEIKKYIVCVRMWMCVSVGERVGGCWVHLVDWWCCPWLWHTPTHTVKAKRQRPGDEGVAYVCVCTIEVRDHTLWSRSPSTTRTDPPHPTVLDVWHSTVIQITATHWKTHQQGGGKASRAEQQKHLTLWTSD